MIPAPAPPEGAAEVSRCIERFVAGHTRARVGFQDLAVLRGDIAAWESRSLIASWHLRVS